MQRQDRDKSEFESLFNQFLKICDDSITANQKKVAMAEIILTDEEKKLNKKDQEILLEKKNIAVARTESKQHQKELNTSVRQFEKFSVLQVLMRDLEQIPSCITQSALIKIFKVNSSFDALGVKLLINPKIMTIVMKGEGTEIDIKNGHDFAEQLLKTLTSNNDLESKLTFQNILQDYKSGNHSSFYGSRLRGAQKSFSELMDNILEAYTGNTKYAQSDILENFISLFKNIKRYLDNANSDNNLKDQLGFFAKRKIDLNTGALDVDKSQQSAMLININELIALIETQVNSLDSQLAILLSTKPNKKITGKLSLDIQNIKKHLDDIKSNFEKACPHVSNLIVLSNAKTQKPESEDGSNFRKLSRGKSYTGYFKFNALSSGSPTNTEKVNAPITSPLIKSLGQKGVEK